MPEIWKPVAGHEGRYEVSDLGHVRNLDRKCQDGRFLRGKILKPGHQISGHLHVVLGYKGPTFRIHTLVLTAFVGPRADGLECCHNDGNPKNNALSNLRWGTRSENAADQERHGTKLLGPRNHRTKLKLADVKEIKRLRGKISQVKLAKFFNAGKSTIQAIHDGRTWRDA